MTDTVLSTHAITKRFGALVANDAVSIDLVPGEIHAIIGPNGAGKSTLIAQICGSQRPDSGTVKLLGRDVTHDATQNRARSGLARTFQISSLALESTVLQNAMIGALGASGKRPGLLRPALKDTELLSIAEAALERTGLTEQRSMRASELSHGERRQLEVAVALTMKPKLLVMDEPMAGLGSGGSFQLTKLLDGLRHEAPILLVEHDMDAVFTLADRISVLVYGKVVATGTVDEIRANEEVRHAYLGDDH